jgi:SP family galactose:H+ symporter-like MFS transporter
MGNSSPTDGKRVVSPAVIIAIVSMSGFLFGYTTSVISGALLYMSTQFALSSDGEEWLVSIVPMGALLGAFVAGFIADHFGRRSTLMLTSILFLLGTALGVWAQSLELLMIGRGITGIAVGIASMAAPLYLAEMAPPQSRGLWVTINQLILTVGILVAYSCNYSFASASDWRSMLAIAFVPAGLQLVGLFFLPESPAWKSGERKRGEPWTALFTAAMRRPLLIGVGLSILQQITGINTVIYYAPRIFKSAQMDRAEVAILATVGIGVINVIATMLSAWLLDKIGRRILLLIGSLGMGGALLVLVLGFVSESQLIDVIAVASLMAYVGFFAIGLGPVPWLIISEIYPGPIRGRAMGVATFANWGFNIVVAFTFIDLLDWAGTSGAFLLYAAICIVAFFFSLRLVPETKGKSLAKS